MPARTCVDIDQNKKIKNDKNSRKMNIFMYGADEKRRGVSCPSARVFPKLLSWNRLGRKYVSFKDCSFAVKKGREATARVVVVSEEKGTGSRFARF